MMMAGVVRPDEFRMVVAPATRFATIAAALEALGLEAGPDDSVTAPAIPGEREFAYWTPPDGDALVHYSFNPAVLLRVLVFSGGDALRWRSLASAQLPALAPADLRRLLQSPEPREVLLGLFAAAELKAAALIGDIEPLRVHRDQRISQAAARAAETIALAVLAAGAERLAAEQRRHPDRSALFPRLGDAARRREVLQWLAFDADELNEEVVKVLRAALADEDWRVRVTAMLVAARLRAAALWPEIRRLELPATSRDGLDRSRRSLLHAARKAALAELAGEPLPTGDDDKARLTRRLRDVLAGRSDEPGEESLDWLKTWLEPPPRAP